MQEQTDTSKGLLEAMMTLVPVETEPEPVVVSPLDKMIDDCQVPAKSWVLKGGIEIETLKKTAKVFDEAAVSFDEIMRKANLPSPVQVNGITQAIRAKQARDHQVTEQRMMTILRLEVEAVANEPVVITVTRSVLIPDTEIRARGKRSGHMACYRIDELSIPADSDSLLAHIGHELGQLISDQASLPASQKNGAVFYGPDEPIPHLGLT